MDGVKHAGVLSAAGGVVRLLKWADYPADWDPESEARLPVWEALHQLIRVFKTEGESGAGALLAGRAGKSRSHPPARLSPLHAVRTRWLG